MHCVWGFVAERKGFAPTDKEKMERRERSQHLPSPVLEDFTYVHSFTYHSSPLSHVEIYEGRGRISGDANLAWIFKAALWLRWHWKSDLSYSKAPAVHMASPKWLVYMIFTWEAGFDVTSPVVSDDPAASVSFYLTGVHGPGNWNACPRQSGWRIFCSCFKLWISCPTSTWNTASSITNVQRMAQEILSMSLFYKDRKEAKSKHSALLGIFFSSPNISD